jgi:diguanylate cyclase
MNFHFFSKIIKLDSMRARYVAGAVLLSIMFVASVRVTHVFISGAVSQTAKTALQRNQVLDSHRTLREKLRKAEYALQTYLVSPEKSEYKYTLLQLDEAIQCVLEVKDNVWVKENNQHEKMLSLLDELLLLKKIAKELMDVRGNAEELFPAYEIINSAMLPRNIEFNTQIKLALEDLSTRLAEAEVLKSYHQFSHIKDSWNAMIGAFRMYVASRAVSLRDPVDKNSESIIELHYRHLRNQLIELSSLQHDYDYGLQAEVSVEEMSVISRLWYQAYLKTKLIYSSSNWRTDETIMNQKIQPLNKKIWLLINQIERAIALSSDADVNQLVAVTTDVNLVLWLRMLIALVFIVTAFLAFEYWILRPVAIISHALKLEAEGEEIESLPKANTRETRELIQAFEEMRSQVRIRQMELEHQAMHDVLTGLPNRLSLRRRLIAGLKKSRENDTELALLMIDLNKFKEINDTLGHHMGDRVLREIGPRFMAELSNKDMLSRLGGDEFAILLTDTDGERANEVAQRLSRCLDVDFNMDGQRLRVGSSIGIALYPKHGTNEQSLLQRADVAMYLAKNKELDYLVYDESQDEQSTWQLSFKGELQKAIENNQLELHYQPKINLKENKTTGVEALLRWYHPEHGLIPADEIHLLAEKTGLIKALTQWVVTTAVKQVASWSEKNIPLGVSVNLSVWNLQDPKLYDCVKEELREWNVPAGKLVLEISESAIMSDPDSSISMLNKLSKLGVSLSIDDFGTGFSSLQYLKKFPVNELKIDKSFVMDMIVDENDAVIVQSTIGLAKNLGMNVIAEGVESQDIYDILKSLGCNDAQGFHMAHAMPVEKLEKWLQESVWGGASGNPLKLIK